MDLHPQPTPAFQEALRKLRLPEFRPRSSNRPTIVALEGPNAAGKTTLVRNLSAKLGVPTCLGTDAAWFSEQFKTRMIRDAEWHASAMFFFSGCFEQMRVLRSSGHRLVIMDRSIWSTLAVHAAEKVDRLSALVRMLEPIAAEVEVPDLTLVLEASFATCRARIAAKTGTARALDELTANQGFHERERQFYHWIAGQVPGVEFLEVDRDSVEQVTARAAALIQRLGLC
jgi:thymidylate kinase